jgi:hypothetical protein
MKHNNEGKDLGKTVEKRKKERKERNRNEPCLLSPRRGSRGPNFFTNYLSEVTQGIFNDVKILVHEFCVKRLASNDRFKRVEGPNERAKINCLTRRPHIRLLRRLHVNEHRIPWERYCFEVAIQPQCCFELTLCIRI